MYSDERKDLVLSKKYWDRGFVVPNITSAQTHFLNRAIALRWVKQENQERKTSIHSLFVVLRLNFQERQCCLRNKHDH